jgi:hypothetical protein
VVLVGDAPRVAGDEEDPRPVRPDDSLRGDRADVAGDADRGGPG